MKIIKSLGVLSTTILLAYSSAVAFAQDDESLSESPTETESLAVPELPEKKAAAEAPVAELKDEENNELEKIATEDQPHFQSLFFDPILNNVQMPKQSVDYEMRSGDAIRIGPLELRGEDVSMSLTQEETEVWELQFGLQYTTKWKRLYFMTFRWPTDYLGAGRMELLDDQSKVLWGKEITDEDLSSWEKFLKKEELTATPDSKDAANAETRDAIKNISRVSRVHRGSQFGYIGRELLTIPLWNIKKPFRFCVTQESEEGRLAFCSKRYRFVRESGKYRVEVVSKQVRPRVLVNNKPVSLKGTAIFLDNKSPIKFASVLASGTYFEFVASPKQVDILDLVKSDDGKFIEAIGFGHKPLGDAEIIERSKEDFWSFLNFMPSIGDQREYWRMRFPYENPYLYFQGNGGIPFRQAFLFEDLPSERFRPKISRNTKTSSYNDNPVIRGKIDASIPTVKSNEVSAHKVSSTEFEWKYAAKNRGEVNQSSIIVEDKDKSWKAYHDLYRGYPRELGLRLTGVLTNELELVFLGEAAAQWWFESLLGWENKVLSYQRWGLAAKYFQSFASFGGKKEPGEDAKLIKLQVTTVDLKYRLTPGVWNHDPTIGLILNTQSLVFENFEVQMAGAGAFWARSMPNFLDKALNWIPIFDYPKWVDAEFLLYPMPLTAQTKLGPNFSVNFHGKIQWTKQFFGEAGFGIKSYSFSDLTPNQRRKVALGIAYGTVGLGYNF